MKSKKLPRTGLQQQKGVVLILSIIMVLVISIAAISAVDISQVNQTVIRNQQEVIRAEQVANEVIEQLLDSGTEFLNAAQQQKQRAAAGDPVGTYSLAINMQRPGFNSFDVTVTDIRCSYAHKISGYSLTTASVPETNYFEIDVEVVDPNTNVTTRMTQGVKFNYPANLCFDS